MSGVYPLHSPRPAANASLSDLVRGSRVAQRAPAADFSAAMGTSLVESYMRSPPDRAVDLMGKGREFLGADADGLWRKTQQQPQQQPPPPPPQTLQLLQQQQQQQPVLRAGMAATGQLASSTKRNIQASVLASTLPAPSDMPMVRNQPVSLAISVATSPSLLSCVPPVQQPVPKVEELFRPDGLDIYCNSPADIYAKLLKNSAKSQGIAAGEALLMLGTHIATASWGHEDDLKMCGLFGTASGTGKKQKKRNMSKPLDPRFDCICAVRTYLEREYRDLLEAMKNKSAELTGLANKSLTGSGTSAGGASGVASAGIGYLQSGRFMKSQMVGMAKNGQYGNQRMLGYGDGISGLGMYNYGDGYGTAGYGIDGFGYGGAENTFATAEQQYPGGLAPLVPAPVLKGPTTITNISSELVMQALNRLVMTHPQLLSVNMNVTTVLHPTLIPCVLFILLRAGMRSEALKLVKSLVIGINSTGRSTGALSGMASNAVNHDSVSELGFGSGNELSSATSSRTDVGLNQGHGIGFYLSCALQGFCKDPTRDTWDGSDGALVSTGYVSKSARDKVKTKYGTGGNVLSTGMSSPSAKDVMMQSNSGYSNGMQSPAGVSNTDMQSRHVAPSPSSGVPVPETIVDEIYGDRYADLGDDFNEKYRKSSSYNKNDLSKNLVLEFQAYKSTLTAAWTNNTTKNSTILGSSHIISGSNFGGSVSGSSINGLGSPSPIASQKDSRLTTSSIKSVIPNIQTPIPVLASIPPVVRALHIYYLAMLYTVVSRMCVSEPVIIANDGSMIDSAVSYYGNGGAGASGNNNGLEDSQMDTSVMPLLPALDVSAMDTGVGTSMGVGVRDIPSDINSRQWYYRKGKSGDGKSDGELIQVSSWSVLTLADYLWVRMSMVDEGRKDSMQSLKYQQRLATSVDERKTLTETGRAGGSLRSSSYRMNESKKQQEMSGKYAKTGNIDANQTSSRNVSRTSLAAFQAEIKALPAGYFSNPSTQSGFNLLSSAVATGAMQMCACYLCTLQYQEAMYALVGSTPATSSIVTANSTVRGTIESRRTGQAGAAGGFLAECGGWMGVRSCNSAALELAASLALILLSGKCREEDQIESLFDTYSTMLSYDNILSGKGNEKSTISLSSNVSHPLTIPLGLLAPLMALINANNWSPELIRSILLLIRGNVYYDPDEYIRSALTILGALILAHSIDPLMGLKGPEFLGLVNDGSNGGQYYQDQRMGDYVTAFYKHPLLNILSVRLSNETAINREGILVPHLNCEMFANALRIAAHWSATGGGVPLNINSISGINNIINGTSLKNSGSLRNFLPPVAACKFRAILLYALCTEADRLGKAYNIDIDMGKVAFSLYGVIETVACDTTLLSMLCSLISETLCAAFSHIADSVNRNAGSSLDPKLYSSMASSISLSKSGYSAMPTSAGSHSLKMREILLAFAYRVIDTFKYTLKNSEDDMVRILTELTDTLDALDEYQRPSQNTSYGDIYTMFLRVYVSLLRRALGRNGQFNMKSRTLADLSGSVSVVSATLSSLTPVVLRVLQSAVVAYKSICASNDGCVDDGKGSDGFSVDRAYQILGGIMNIF